MRASTDIESSLMHATRADAQLKSDCQIIGCLSTGQVPSDKNITLPRADRRKALGLLHGVLG